MLRVSARPSARDIEIGHVGHGFNKRGHAKTLKNGNNPALYSINPARPGIPGLDTLLTNSDKFGHNRVSHRPKLTSLAKNCQAGMPLPDGLPG